MDEFLAGWLALGAIAGPTFTEIAVGGSYQRQAATLSYPKRGSVVVNNPVQFVESAGVAFGPITAVAVCNAPTGGSPLFCWSLARASCNPQAYENVTFDVGSLGFRFLDATGLSGAVIPFAGVAFTSGQLVGLSSVNTPVYTGTAGNVLQ